MSIPGGSETFSQIFSFQNENLLYAISFMIRANSLGGCVFYPFFIDFLKRYIFLLDLKEIFDDKVEQNLSYYLFSN